MPEEGKGGQEPPKGQGPAAATATPDPPKTEPETKKGDEPVTFDADYVKGLRSEAAKNRKEAQEAKAKVQDFEDRDKTETEKLTGKVESLTSENKSTKAENLRLRVALEKKLPPELIDRLKGSSQEEIEADADELLKLVKTENPPPTMDGGAREPAGDPKSPEQAHNDLLLQSFGRPRS